MRLAEVEGGRADQVADVLPIISSERLLMAGAALHGVANHVGVEVTARRC